MCDSYNHSAIMNVGKKRGHNFVTRGNKDYYLFRQQLQLYQQWMSMQQVQYIVESKCVRVSKVFLFYDVTTYSCSSRRYSTAIIEWANTTFKEEMLDSNQSVFSKVF